MASMEGTVVHQILQFVGYGEPGISGESLPTEAQGSRGVAGHRSGDVQLDKVRGMEGGEVG